MALSSSSRVGLALVNGVGEVFRRGKIRPISELSQRSFMSYEVQGPMTWITYGWRKAVEAVDTASFP